MTEWDWKTRVLMAPKDGSPTWWVVDMREVEKKLAELREDNDHKAKYIKDLEEQRNRAAVLDDGAEGGIERRDIEIEQRDAVLELAMPAIRFVNHIQGHINKGEPTPDIRGQEVVCKICGKTITEIFEEGES
jgi:hypothetical protein